MSVLDLFDDRVQLALQPFGDALPEDLVDLVGRLAPQADLTAVLESVAREIGPHLAHGAVVVNKSTVPVGSALLVERLLNRPGVPVVSNPEFLREGSAVHDALHPDRIVVGADDQAAAARVGALFAATQAPLIVTDAATAETIKYAS